MKSPYIKGKDYVVAITLEIVYSSFHILEKSNQCTSRILYNSYSELFHAIVPFCQPQLANLLAALLFPLGKGVLSYPLPLKGGRIRASPGVNESIKCQRWDRLYSWLSALKKTEILS